jgi:hypothetical protein
MPAAFVFRDVPGDPHPIPFIRVKISAAIGQALYPHPQWAHITELWSSLYPSAGLERERRELFAELEASTAAFADFLVSHRPRRLGGQMLGEAIGSADRTPQRLLTLFEQRRSVAKLTQLRPSLAFAVIGQARNHGVITPELEGDLLAELLRRWAWRATVDASEVCAHTRALETRFPIQAVR